MQQIDLSCIRPNRDQALMLAKREISTFVYDAVQLEGIHFTLPEIQTLLDGVTVGGRKLSDQKIALNQRDAWHLLFQWIKERDFVLSRYKVCELHALAAEEEALKWGQFRDSGVTIAGTSYMPPSANDLVTLFEEMVLRSNEIIDIFDKAIFVFLQMARTQFFFDVNKRMGRFMMNGILLDAGYPAINVPVKRKLEFNEYMLRFYDSGDQTEMNQFLRSCIDPRIVAIMSS